MFTSQKKISPSSSRLPASSPQVSSSPEPATSHAQAPARSRFGHHFGNMSVLPPAPVQAKGGKEEKPIPTGLAGKQEVTPESDSDSAPDQEENPVGQVMGDPDLLQMISGYLPNKDMANLSEVNYQSHEVAAVTKGPETDNKKFGQFGAEEREKYERKKAEEEARRAATAAKKKRRSEQNKKNRSTRDGYRDPYE